MTPCHTQTSGVSRPSTPEWGGVIVTRDTTVAALLIAGCTVGMQGDAIQHRSARHSPRVWSGFNKEQQMLRWALTFFIVAIIAAVFGFTGIASGAVQIAQILFVVFIVLFLISLITGLTRRGSTRV